MHAEYWVVFVMGTFNRRWGKTWKEANIIAVMHLLAVYTKSLNKLDPLPSFKYYRQCILKYSYTYKLDFPCFGLFLFSVLDLHNFNFNKKYNNNSKSFFRIYLCLDTLLRIFHILSHMSFLKITGGRSLSPFYRWINWVTEILINFPKVTQGVGRNEKTWKLRQITSH